MVLSSNLLDNRDDIDPCRAGLHATAATDTARAAVLGNKPALFVIKAEFDS
jgi:hypothetical protein